MSDRDSTPELRALVERVVTLAKKRGAKEAEAMAERSRHASVRVRAGEIEELSEAASKGVGLRVLRDGRLGFASTTDFDLDGLERLVDRALALSKEAAPDPANGLPTRADLVSVPRGEVHGLFDPAVAELDPGWKLRAAFEAERAATAEDARCDNFEDSGAGEAVGEAAIASTIGLLESERSTSVWVYCSPVAREGDQLQTGSWSDHRRSFAALEGAESVGREAARRTVRMLGARRAETCRVPVVFDPLVAASFFGGIAGAVNGDLVYRKASFLAGKLGQQVASPLLTLVDDPHEHGAIGAGTFDGEGVPTRRTPILEAGILRSFLYDVRTARKAKAKSTGHARRGYSSLPSVGPLNLRLEGGATDPIELLRPIRSGLYVTSMLGRSLSPVTGDFSTGANGLWIENGVLAWPVQEVTVAGNLAQMLQAVDAVGSDVLRRGSVAAPTVRFAELAVGGR